MNIEKLLNCISENQLLFSDTILAEGENFSEYLSAWWYQLSSDTVLLAV